MKRPILILVGGFLGAGKTTLLWQAARRLTEAGKRVGLVTNDQAPQLVDTSLLADAGLTVEEIAGGCFCCKFNDLIAATDCLIEKMAPDVLIGEPVGSCTDISATVVQPIKELFADRFRMAPFSVLADPYRLEEAIDPRLPSPLHASARYILRKQLEEADLIVLNKADQLDGEDLADLKARAGERFPGTPLMAISALDGDNVDEWLNSMQNGGPAGQRITEVDYDIYAEGEAVLGWLNATIMLTAVELLDWRSFCEELLRRLQQAALKRAGEIAHVKLLLSTIAGQYAANLTRGGGKVAVRGAMADNPRSARLTVNARVEMDPEELRTLVIEALRGAADGKVDYAIEKIDCLSPGRPRPTHRYSAVIG